MATVKLTTARSRGASEYAAGESYECSDAEAAALIENGAATKVAEAKEEPKKEAPKVEAAAVADAPETATRPKPNKR